MNATASQVDRLLAMLEDPREDRVRIESGILRIRLTGTRQIALPCASGNARAVLEVVCARRGAEIGRFLMYA